MRSLLSSTRRPGHFTLVVLILTFTAGLNAALFALIRAATANASALEEANAVYVLYRRYESGLSDTFSVTALRNLQAAERVFVSVGADVTRDPVWQDFAPRVTWGTGGPPVRATAATAGFFETLGVPVIGRTFTPADDVAGARAAIVNADFVHRQLGVQAARDAIGRELDLGSVRATIVGVVPAAFHGPRRGDDSDVWLCLGALPSSSGLPSELALSHAKLTMYVRLVPGVGPQDAVRAIDALRSNGAFLRTFVDARYPPWLEPYRADDEWLVGLLIWTSALVLTGGALSLCALELARAEARRGEVAVELSLGATPGRLVRDGLFESIPPVAVGAGCATAAAHWALILSRDLRLPDGLPLSALHAGTQWPVAALAVSVCALQVGAAALMGVLQALRRSPASLLRAVEPTATGSARLRARLLAAHAAITAVLLVGSLVFVQTVRKATTADLGFAAKNVLEVFIQPSMAQIAASGADLTETFERFIRELEQQPDVVTATNGALPLLDPRLGTSAGGSLRQLAVGPGYVEATGLTLIAGRDIVAADAETDPKQVVVSQSVVRSFPPHLTIGSAFDVRTPDRHADGENRFIVAGIVKDALRIGIRGTPVAAIYVPSPLEKGVGSKVMLATVIRVRGDAASALPRIERLARSRFPNAARLQIRTAAHEVAQELRGQFLAALLFSCYGLVALTMAFVSIFGLVSFLAVRGAREVAIRMALGAPRSHVLWTLCRQIAGPVLAGLVVGEALAAVGAHAVSSQLFGVRPGDPYAYVAAAAVLSTVAAAACWRPARAALDRNLLDQLREG